jgi:hypothetical protein
LSKNSKEDALEHLDSAIKEFDEMEDASGFEEGLNIRVDTEGVGK